MAKKVYCFLNNRPGHNYILQFLLTLIFMLSLCGSASAVDYTLSWDANSEPDLAGYRVYYKANSSGQPAGDYDEVIDVGNETSKMVEGLDENTVYYFAVTAYDTSGLESDFSNEISNAAAITLPDAGSTPYLMTAGNEPDSLALFAEGGVFSEGINWSLGTGSVGSISPNGRTVVYSAPSDITGDSATAAVMLRNDAGTLLGQQVITIYKPVTIENKLTDNQTVYAGESTDPFTVQGGNGSYTWTVKKDGVPVGQYSGASFVFNTSAGEAAGLYTITVTDGNNFTDSFDVNVLNYKSPPTDNGTENDNQDISGYIVNEYGVGIDNADVILVSPGQFAGSAVTDIDGYFSFSDIPDVNKYHFRASKNGYISKEFTSDDLLQDDINLEIADTYISGEITVYGTAFSGEPVEITLSYIENGMGIMAGRAISPDGNFRIDFDEAAGVSEYILTAARPGEYGQISFGSALQSGVTIDIDTTLYGDDVNALAGGSSQPVTIAGQSASILRVPYGGIDPSSGVPDILIDIASADNTGSTYTSDSGNLLYTIDMDYPNITTILTLPFDLAEVSPGDFENGNAVIYHADTVNELILGGNAGVVDAADIISVDYVGDGSTGLVEFYADSLSVFGIGSADSTSSAGGLSAGGSAGGGDAGGCFITTIADAAGDAAGFQRLLILFGVLVLTGFVMWKMKRIKIATKTSAVAKRFHAMAGQAKSLRKAI